MRKTIGQLKFLRESENKVEFKKVRVVMFRIMVQTKQILQIEEDVYLDT